MVIVLLTILAGIGGLSLLLQSKSKVLAEGPYTLEVYRRNDAKGERIFHGPDNSDCLDMIGDHLASKGTVKVVYKRGDGKEKVFFPNNHPTRLYLDCDD